MLWVVKDFVENNKNVRVLVVCSEVIVVMYCVFNENYFDGFVGFVLFGDGVVVFVVGVDFKLEEKLLFEVYWVGEMIFFESDGVIDGYFIEVGFIFYLMKDVFGLIFKNIEKFLSEVRKCVGFLDWNDMFWVVYFGGFVILD